MNNSFNKPHIPIPKEEIVAFCQSHYITDLALFGSVLTDQFTNASDVDILVEFDPAHIPGFFGIVEMEDELTRIVGRRADLRTAKDLSRYFRDDVIKRAYLIYGKGQFRTH